jgi:hypothetical protein
MANALKLFSDNSTAKSGMILSFLIFALGGLWAQSESHYSDRIWLHNGSTLVGELVDYQEDVIRLKLRSGNVVVINKAEVKRIAQYSPDPSFSSYGNLFFQDRELKHIFSMDAGLGFLRDIDATT